MPDFSPQDMKGKLQTSSIQHAGPAVEAASDPIVDTPMMVTLEQLRPYELNPRLARNPRYNEIKASIRERGLDSPPAITRRPGDVFYIIRNGGNTRLAILQELWTETKDEKFFRIPCFFRPWPARGEIIALTGHLAENELHGDLSFIERALGVQKARELYQQETRLDLSQRDLAQRLTADGYPISQSYISKMEDAIVHLLPAIPTILYAGLGRRVVERITVLRIACARVWERRANPEAPTVEFPALFQEVLSTFDGDLEHFSVQRVRDELVKDMAQLLVVPYDTLHAEIADSEESRDPAGHGPVSSLFPLGERITPAEPIPVPAPTPISTSARMPTTMPTRTNVQQALERTPTATRQPSHEDLAADGELTDRLKGHIVSPAETTDRLQTIQRTIAEATDEPIQDFRDNVLRAIPVQAGGLYPISDVWYIEPSLDTPNRLRVHIAQLAAEIAQEGSLEDRVEAVEDGIGFVCTAAPSRSKEPPRAPFQRAILTLLTALSSPYSRPAGAAIEGMRFIDDLGPLLQGGTDLRRARSDMHRLSDAAIVKLFRSIRLTRRLLELEAADAAQSGDESR